MDCPLCVSGCEECEDGAMIFDRCPNHEMTGKEPHVIRSWAMLKEHNTWPVLGGLDDQASWFVDAVQFLDQESAAFNKREIERLKGGK